MIHYFVCDGGTRVTIENESKGWFSGQQYFIKKECAAKEAIKQMKNEIERLKNLIDAVEKDGIDAINF